MNVHYSNIIIRPSSAQFAASNMPGCILCLALLVLAGWDRLMPQGIVAFLLILCFITLVYLMYKYLYLELTKYIITGEQLKYRKGIFSTTWNYIELYRIVDYSETRTFMQILFGVKTISIYSGDRTNPRIDLLGIDSDRDLISEIRSRVEYNKTLRNIHEFTNIR